MSRAEQSWPDPGSYSGRPPPAGVTRTVAPTTTRREQGRSGLLLTDVHHPSDPELIQDHAELVAPGLLLQRHRYRAFAGQLVPVAVKFAGVIPGQADRDVVARLVLHPGRGVGGHERVTARGLELGVHDLVRTRTVWRAEFAKGVQVQRAPQDLLVELHGFARVAVKADVGIETRGHRRLLGRHVRSVPLAA